MEAMNSCQPKKVTYRARSHFRSDGTTWYLTYDKRQYLWRWTGKKGEQTPISDLDTLIRAIAAAGGPDERNVAPGGWWSYRDVIVETDTHEEQEFDHFDHSRWQSEQKSNQTARKDDHGPGGSLIRA